MNLQTNERAQRKLMVTIAEWPDANGTITIGTGTNRVTVSREILGTRTPDSSIEFNADIETSTDILGITYTDINKTEPSQTFDPYYIIGGKKLGEYMTTAALTNNINAYNGKFNIYIVTLFIIQGTTTVSDAKYYTVKHSGCSIIPTSMGGESFLALPFEVHFSNDITEGTIDKLAEDFTFTTANSSLFGS
jgi:hypothetical protein